MSKRNAPAADAHPLRALRTALNYIDDCIADGTVGEWDEWRTEAAEGELMRAARILKQLRETTTKQSTIPAAHTQLTPDHTLSVN